MNQQILKVPKIDWILFDKNNIPYDLNDNATYLVLIREDNYDNGKTWRYSIDYAKPYGDYIDDFWTTSNDWCEGQRVEVLAYAEFPYAINEDELEYYIKENNNENI